MTTSVSQGVSALVSALPLEQGRNRIVISEYEFPTIGQIAHAQELRGAEVVHVTPGEDGSIGPERFAEAIDEREIGVASLAAPVFGPGGDVVAAISVGAPVLRFLALPREHLVRCVVEAGEAVSRRLGWSPEAERSGAREAERPSNPRDPSSGRLEESRHARV